MKKEIFNINKKDLRLVLFCAFRYSLGRRTYMPWTITELIKKNSHLFNSGDWTQFIEEIKEHERISSLGDDCDIKKWENFIKFCKEQNNEK
ncbi:MAG: hypothetical protein ACOC1P_05400 [Minisyncoccales bacterium]